MFYANSAEEQGVIWMAVNRGSGKGYYELSDFRTPDLVKSLACFALVRK